MRQLVDTGTESFSTRVENVYRSELLLQSSARIHVQ